jgi:hypothetical protein
MPAVKLLKKSALGAEVFPGFTRIVNLLQVEICGSALLAQSTWPERRGATRFFNCPSQLKGG